MKHLIVFLFILLPVAVTAAPPLEKPSLISTDWLARNLEDPRLRIIDARSSLAPYIGGHIPGAVYLNTESMRISKGGVPARLLPAELLGEMFGKIGIGNDHTVVVYSSGEDNFAHAAYVVFVLEWLGHQSIGLLDGGIEKWKHEDRELTMNFPDRREVVFKTRPNPSILKEATDVQRSIRAGIPLLDARGPAIFSSGHIPTAKNFFLAETLTGEEVKTWKSKEELLHLAAEAGVSPETPAITYCTSGRESAQIWFTLRHVAGLENIASYHGSIIDWRARGNSLSTPAPD